MKQLAAAIARKFRAHTRLGAADLAELEGLDVQIREFGRDEDIVRQGDKPKHAAVVLKGMLGRYHPLPNGARQYLAFHIAGDFPDAQGLFLEVMDHSVCSIDRARVGLIPHRQLRTIFETRPSLGTILWRETLIDAAIFRQAITNNSSRPPVSRLAHFFCEQMYRATAAGLAVNHRCDLPLSQRHLAAALGMSLISVSRAARALRELVRLEQGVLTITSLPRLVVIAQFDPSYLHAIRPVSFNI